MALPSSSRRGRSMPELLCHPISFVMRRVVYDLRRPRAGGCERTRENSAYIFFLNDGMVLWAAGANCDSGTTKPRTPRENREHLEKPPRALRETRGTYRNPERPRETRKTPRETRRQKRKFGNLAPQMVAAQDVKLVYASFWPFLEFKNDFHEKRKS